MARKQLQETDKEAFCQRGRQQNVRWKGRHAKQTDEPYRKGKKKHRRLLCLVVCVCLCNRGRVIGCGREQNTVSVCWGVGLCPPSLWLQPHLPCILKRQNAEPWTQLLALHQSSRLTLTHKTEEATHHQQPTTATWHWVSVHCTVFTELLLLN